MWFWNANTEKLKFQVYTKQNVVLPTCLLLFNLFILLKNDKCLGTKGVCTEPGSSQIGEISNRSRLYRSPHGGDSVCAVKREGTERETQRKHVVKVEKALPSRPR
jgi:hypothetical protein